MIAFDYSERVRLTRPGDRAAMPHGGPVSVVLFAVLASSLCRYRKRG
jgi:hypothetical protein